MTVSLTKGFNFFNIVNSYTAIGDNNRILQTAVIQKWQRKM